jgi:redox-sensing transcriptional repressor
MREIGSRWNGLVVRDVKHLEADLKKDPSAIDRIVATPAESAQHVVDRLVRSGVKATTSTLRRCPNVPSDVEVKTVNMALELETLSYSLANR